MIENVLYSGQIISLLLGLLWLGCQCLWAKTGARGYFNTAKVSVLASAAFSILFYNKTVLPDFFAVSSFTVLFYVLTAFIAFAWLSLTLRWFTNEDLPACGFCATTLCALMCLLVILTTVNLGVLFAGLCGLAVVNYHFLRFSQESEELHPVSRRYGWSAAFFAVLMLTALCVLMPENWNFAMAEGFIGGADLFLQIIVSGGILFFILFLIGLAPFHFWFSDSVVPSVLPVGAYFNLIPFFSLWGLFIKINSEVMVPVSNALGSSYIIFGIFSVLIGAIGANASRNMRKMFAYAGLYNIGVMVMMISSFKPEAALGMFVYMQVYILAMFGVYTCFYSFKSHGDYITNLSMIGGLYKVRPYISGAMLFFMVSLMAIAPLPGFLGQLAALYTFALQTQYALIFVILAAMLILMAAYLQIIRTMYFAQRETEFDRPDHGVYVYLLINILLIGILVFRPHFLLHDAEIILSSVLG